MNFYYKVEPFKGYIPSDKVSVNGQSFESAYDVIPKRIRNHYEEVRKEKGAKEGFKATKDGIEGQLLMWLQKRNMKQINNLKKPFYINFNRDGMDVFISRSNWLNQ